MRVGAPPGRVLVGLIPTLGTDEQTQAVPGTDEEFVLAHLPCPAPSSPPTPSRVKVQLGGGRPVGWVRQRAAVTVAAHRSPRPASSLSLEAQPESILLRTLLGFSE